MCIVRIISSNSVAVTTTPAVELMAAKTYAWTARITTDVDVFLSIGGTATSNDYRIIAGNEHLIAIPANAALSVIGSAAANVSVAEVKISS